ncbi:MAG TPA: hypothetical protein VFZ78_07665, partial [Flavisolibacter sp.]
LASGNTFTTPTISSTTTYYVAAASAAASCVVGPPPSGSSCGTISAATAANYSVRFNTIGPVTLNSAWAIPTTAGNFVIALRTAGSGTDLQLASFNVTAANVGQPMQLTFNWAIPNAGNYQLINIQGPAHYIPSFTCSYPMTCGNLSIVGASTSSTGGTVTNLYGPFFWLNVTEACESVRVPVVATVNAVTSINTQPQSQAVCAGANVTFSVDATGANLTYQWQLNGNNITGATNSSFVINNSSPANNGNYSVVITGLCGSVTSSIASLSVSPSNAWLGVFNSDWNNPVNWCGGVPSSTTDVVIPSGTPFAPVINGLADVRNITINNGATLTVTPTGVFAIYGNFTNSGTVSADNAFIFFKGLTNQTVSAISTGTVVVNGTGGITLTGNMNTGTLIMQNGNITLGANNISYTGSINGSLSSHIITNGTGSAISRVVGAGPVVIPVGTDAASFNPVTIVNGQNRDYAVRVEAAITPSIANNNRAVNRTWHISPSTAVSNVQVTLQYADAHGNSSFVNTAPVEVASFNGAIWTIASPAGGITPLGVPTERKVTFSTSSFGTFVISSPGGISYPTNIVSVNPDITGIVLMPNAVQSNTVMRISARRAMNISWSVVDAAGRVVMRFNSKINAGTNDIPLDFTRLKAGMYFIAGASGAGRQDVVRFIKL